MVRHKMLYDRFNIIYVECKQESYEINNVTAKGSFAATIFQQANVSSLNTSPRTDDNDLKIRKDRDSVMEEELTENEKIESPEANVEQQEDESSLDTNPKAEDEHLKVAEDMDLEIIEDLAKKEEMKGMIQVATCTPGLNPNCAECCAIFTNNDRRAAFGYQLENVACECHDICVQDVRDICVRRRTIRQTIPCNPDGSAGCRGGVLAAEAPAVQSFRVLCAEERLSPATGCDRIINEIEFEVVLRFGTNTLVVVTPRDTFDCRFFEFARFPSGVFFPNNAAGLNQFRNELALIDGSCKVIIIEDVRVVTEGNNCVLVIEFKVIDKLWKHENLLVSALKPYGDNITVKQEFEQGHRIGPCANDILVADLA